MDKAFEKWYKRAWNVPALTGPLMTKIAKHWAFKAWSAGRKHQRKINND